MSVNPGKKICSVLNKLNNPKYSILNIDFENCIYRKLNEDYDLEISGLDNQKKSFDCTVYVWSIKSSKRIVETHNDIKSYEQLVDVLQSLDKQYG